MIVQFRQDGIRGGNVRAILRRSELCELAEDQDGLLFVALGQDDLKRALARFASWVGGHGRLGICYSESLCDPIGSRAIDGS